MEGWMVSHFQKLGWATKAGKKMDFKKNWWVDNIQLWSFMWTTWEYTGSCHIHVEANGDTATDRIKPGIQQRAWHPNLGKLLGDQTAALEIP